MKRFWLAAWLLLSVSAPWLAPVSFRAQDRGALLQSPSWTRGRTPAGAVPHRLGTDEFGRDVWSRLLVATGLSSLLGVAMAVPALALALALGLGGALAHAGAALTRGAGEVCRSLPWIFVLVAVRAALPLDASALTVALVLIGLFAAAAWPLAAWTLESAARDLLQREFVQAASSLGAGRWHILRRHLWPNLKPLVATYFALLVAAAIGVEVSLELVGLGLPQPWPTWGNML
ncbi:MAG: ABC transporter permease, partial [Terriglobales bacterium]